MYYNKSSYSDFTFHTLKGVKFGQMYYNFPIYFCRFILIDIGQLGRCSDGGVFSNSSFGQAFDDEEMALPNPSCLPDTTGPELPYVMVGDEAFPLRNYLLHPYPGHHLPGKNDFNTGTSSS